MATTATDDLTDRQKEVLELHNQGKNPTEIGNALAISSQAVHGHFRRLREKGLIPGDGPPRAAAAKRRPNARRGLDAAAAVDAVRQAAEQQRDAIHGRQQEIDAEIASLNAERSELDGALQAIAGMLGQGESST